MTTHVLGGELTTGLWQVKVQLITGYNHDTHDIRAGGSTIFGPYYWVTESHRDQFVAEMQRRYGGSGQVHKIEATERRFVPADKIPSLAEEVADFEKYLKATVLHRN